MREYCTSREMQDGEDKCQQSSAAGIQPAHDAMGKDESQGVHVVECDASAKFAKVQAAWEVLKDEERRRRYDEKLARAFRPGRLLPGGATSSVGRNGGKPKRRLQMSPLVRVH